MHTMTALNGFIEIDNGDKRILINTSNIGCIFEGVHNGKIEVCMKLLTTNPGEIWFGGNSYEEIKDLIMTSLPQDIE